MSCIPPHLSALGNINFALNGLLAYHASKNDYNSGISEAPAFQNPHNVGKRV